MLPNNVIENTPLVSVLMTAYNREKYIAEAIQSVLDSSYSNLELIITDDRSKDNTVAIARKFAEEDERVKVYVNEINLGDYPNRNRAAEYAKGKYLKYVDADDTIYIDSLKKFVYAMEVNPDCGLGLTLEHFDLNNMPFIKFTSEETLYSFFNYKGIFHAGPTGSIIRKSSFNKAGGFSGKQFISDLELWIELCKTSPLLVLEGKLVYWREHEDQQMTQGNANDEQFVRTARITNRYLFSKDIPLNFQKRISAIYSVYRYFIMKFFMLAKKRGFKYVLHVYARILTSKI